jgi:D-tyrosyl-tRNA(Tyr) deacylase
MRAVVQRSRAARVEVDGEVTGSIERGLVIFLGAGKGDDEKDVLYLAPKVATLRVFPDGAGKMSRSVVEAGGGLLVVSQFTLFGDVRKGRRPSFDDALEPVRAAQLVQLFVEESRKLVPRVETGRFAADMRVFVENDGPVTLLLDSKRAF